MSVSRRWIVRTCRWIKGNVNCRFTRLYFTDYTISIRNESRQPGNLALDWEGSRVRSKETKKENGDEHVSFSFTVETKSRGNNNKYVATIQKPRRKKKIAHALIVRSRHSPPRLEINFPDDSLRSVAPLAGVIVPWSWSNTDRAIFQRSHHRFYDSSTKWIGYRINTLFIWTVIVFFSIYVHYTIIFIWIGWFLLNASIFLSKSILRTYTYIIWSINQFTSFIFIYVCILKLNHIISYHFYFLFYKKI